MISIKFTLDRQLNELNLLIRPDGFISLQAIGEVRAAGLTQRELGKKIEDSFIEADIFTRSESRRGEARKYHLVIVELEKMSESAWFSVLSEVFSRNNRWAAVRKTIWFWPTTIVSMYVIGMIALLCLARNRGSTVFSRGWLIKIAAKPLLMTPGLGRGIIFLGYYHRLIKLGAVERASKNYFGLPAEDSAGSTILPDATGESLHQRISRSLLPQEPVIVIGNGGAGKSTLLARWAFLALKGQLPSNLGSSRPVLVSASYYENNLIKAVADTLRERDGVALDEETTLAQLQSSNFLILFDGLSEVVGDKQQAFREIIRTARHADFKNCRFLISTRPLEGIPPEICAFHLKPLSSEICNQLAAALRIGPRARESDPKTVGMLCYKTDPSATL